MEGHRDVIIVGARCAGATLGALLSRRGVRTLLLEASPRGTDMPLSTHLVQPPGMDVLDAIGVGDRVRAVTPASARFRYALDESVLISDALPGRAAHCVRRATLDPWLQDAAEASGAELRDRHRVTDLVRDGERVTGVVARTPTGTVTLRADLVVGADGMHSTVAKLVNAPEYLVLEGSRAGYWAYFEAPARWDAEWDATLEHRGRDLRYVFRCDGDLVALVHAGPREEVAGWGRDHREKLLETLGRSPTTAALAAGKEPVGKVLGVLKTRFFYRRPVGPGFALAGDAGHFKDFVTGQGMTDAFLDAERLARAILDGRPQAFEHYWRERDVATLPLHFDAIRQGEVGYNDPFMRWVIASIARRDDLKSRLALVLDRKLSPEELLSTPTLLGFMGRALLRGRLDVLSGFLRTGQAMRAQAKELATRRALFEQSRAALERAPREPARPASWSGQTAPSVRLAV
jgi:2-polyprenyl-6-methoxyphenol hydroxylase-like FAD-dependent oxidoreductase